MTSTLENNKKTAEPHDALAAFDLARAAGESWRWGRNVTVEPHRSGGNASYTVKQENR